MNFTEMSMEELLERRTAIATEVEADGADLDALEAEVRDINAEIESRNKAAEQRAAILDSVKEGEGETVKEFTQETKMEERTFAVDSMEYRNAWLKNLMGLNLDAEERSAMSTVDVVPTITENKIINRLESADLLKYIDLTQFKGAVNIPNYTTNGDADWGASNEQQDVIGHVALSVYQLIKTIEVPGKFDAVSIDAFEAYITEALANKIAAALQTAAITGNGSGKPTGINHTHSTADGTFTKAGITKADLMKIMGALPAKYQKDAVWIMPNKVFYEAMANCDLPGFAAIGADLKPAIAGKPVVVDDACVISSTDTIFYGAAKAYHMNLGAPIEVARDASVGFKSNAVNYRAVCLADGKLDNTAAFVKYTRATA